MGINKVFQKLFKFITDDDDDDDNYCWIRRIIYL